jgi:L-lactate dehydrogenase (cytochrome)
MAGLANILSLDDFERAARKHLPRPIFAYVSGAVEENLSLRDSRAAFEEIGFIPRVLVDVSPATTETGLFGARYSAPFGIAPMGISALSAYRGDLVQARAAMAANIPMIMSATSLIRMEDVCAACPGTWFQAYMPAPAKVPALIDRVEAAGYETLVVTVDVSVLANRENNVRAGFSTPLRPSWSLLWQGITHPRWTFGTFLRTFITHGVPHFENSQAERGVPIVARNVHRDFTARDQFDWKELEKVRKRWKGRIVLKGLMSPEDARIARSAGVEGIIVSNHGGRQLDGTVSPIRVLAEVVEAAGDGVTVMMDSGVRRGTDVLKALALGAKFVWVGRPFNFAASVGGEAGVRHGIELLRSEVRRNMALLGVTRLEELGPRYLRKIGPP